MTEGRSYIAQLTTARMILAMGEQQLAENADTGAHANRLEELHKLKHTWTARIQQLEPLARAEEQREQGQGSAFGL